MNSSIENSTIGNNTEVKNSTIVDSIVGENTTVENVKTKSEKK